MSRELALRAAGAMTVLAAAGSFTAAASATTRPAAAHGAAPLTVSRLAGRLGLEATATRQQALAISGRFGRGALWLFNSQTGRFQSLANVHVPVATIIYATVAHVNAVTHYSAAVSRSAPSANRSTNRLVAPSRVAVPSALGAGVIRFSDNARGSQIDGTRWNTFVTSRAANGSPWNTNNSGGSSSANPTVDNDEEYYLPSGAIIRDGLIDLRATRRPTAGMLGTAAHTYPFSSGALSTYGKFEFTGGYVQVEAKMPSGDGMWPGIWMLPGPGSNSGDNYEIDLFEGGMDDAQGAGPNNTFAWHLHSPSGWVGSDVRVGADLTRAFHIYGLRWVPGQSITWYLDGKQVGQVTSAETSIPTEPMELILTLQVADAATAGWHTVANNTTPASGDMLISGVQVYTLRH